MNNGVFLEKKTERVKGLLDSFAVTKIDVTVRKVDIFPHEEKEGYWVIVTVFDDDTRVDIAKSIVTLMCSEFVKDKKVYDMMKTRILGYPVAYRVELRAEDFPQVEKTLEKFCHLAC